MRIKIKFLNDLINTYVLYLIFLFLSCHAYSIELEDLLKIISEKDNTSKIEEKIFLEEESNLTTLKESDIITDDLPSELKNYYIKTKEKNKGMFSSFELKVSDILIGYKKEIFELAKTIKNSPKNKNNIFTINDIKKDYQFLDNKETPYSKKTLELLLKRPPHTKKLINQRIKLEKKLQKDFGLIEKKVFKNWSQLIEIASLMKKEFENSKDITPSELVSINKFIAFCHQKVKRKNSKKITNLNDEKDNSLNKNNYISWGSLQEIVNFLDKIDLLKSNDNFTAHKDKDGFQIITKYKHSNVSELETKLGVLNATKSISKISFLLNKLQKKNEKKDGTIKVNFGEIYLVIIKKNQTYELFYHNSNDELISSHAIDLREGEKQIITIAIKQFEKNVSININNNEQTFPIKPNIETRINTIKIKIENLEKVAINELTMGGNVGYDEQLSEIYKIDKNKKIGRIALSISSNNSVHAFFLIKPKNFLSYENKTTLKSISKRNKKNNQRLPSKWDELKPIKIEGTDENTSFSIINDYKKNLFNIFVLYNNLKRVEQYKRKYLEKNWDKIGNIQLDYSNENFTKFFNFDLKGLQLINTKNVGLNGNYFIPCIVSESTMRQHHGNFGDSSFRVKNKINILKSKNNGRGWQEILLNSIYNISSRTAIELLETKNSGLILFYNFYLISDSEAKPRLIYDYLASYNKTTQWIKGKNNKSKYHAGKGVKTKVFNNKLSLITTYKNNTETYVAAVVRELQGQNGKKTKALSIFTSDGLGKLTFKKDIFYGNITHVNLIDNIGKNNLNKKANELACLIAQKNKDHSTLNYIEFNL